MLNVSAFFTDADDRITGASESDPMGLLPVWTGFAGQLFRNRVNSRINDLRAYTINLFHCRVVRRIRQNLTEACWEHEERVHFSQGHAPSFTRALMVLQEKMLLASLCLPGDPFEDEGFLGLATARRRKPEGIRLNLHHTKGEVLVRQAQLGFSGAYRSAFTNALHLLDPVNGHPIDHTERWASVDAIFQGIDDYKQLADVVTSLIDGLLRDRNRNELTLAQLESNALPELYRKCFGSKNTLASRFAGFWNETLKLDQDATTSLWNAVAQDGQVEPKALFHAALADPSDSVRVIRTIAPFLARVEHAFMAMREPDVHDKESASRKLVGLYGEIPLQAVVSGMDQAAILGALSESGVARVRLAELFKMASLDADALVSAMLEYHKTRVCEPRSAQPWLENLDGSWRCHMVSDRRIEKPKDADPPWEHDFYAGAFQGLVSQIKHGLPIKEGSQP